MVLIQISKKTCFQRGFGLIKKVTYEQKCEAVTKRNRKTSLVKKFKK